MNGNKFIIVVTHPRSGTHFLINSLCMNFDGLEFPLIRNGYATLEALFYDHDDEYTNEWERCVFEDNGRIKIFKSHSMPSDILSALRKNDFLKEKEKKIIRTIYENSKIINVCRDGRDALVSFYYFAKKAGGSLPKGLEARIRNLSFSDFIRMPNKYYSPVRGYEVRKDKNRVAFWRSHVNEWLNEKGVLTIRYEDLHRKHEETIGRVASFAGLEGRRAGAIEKPLFEPINLKANIFLRALGKVKRTFKPGLTQKGSKLVHPSYPRKGIIGEWKTHFTEEDRQYFSDLAKDVSLKMGYEI